MVDQKKIKISVIVPVYNGAKFIATTIISALDQSYPIHEIIVIDDGSTDNTIEVLSQFKGRIIVKSKANAGVAAARNDAICLATGDYLAFLDADDIWFRDKLKEQMEVLLQYPEVAISCSDYISRYEHLGSKRFRHFTTLKNIDKLNFNAPLNNSFIKNLIIENFIGTCSAVIVKKSVLTKAGGFDTRYRHSEDFDLWLKIGMLSNCILINKVLLYKRTHDTNLTGDKYLFYSSHKHVLDNLLRENFEFVDETGLAKTVNSKLALTSYSLGNIFFENKKVYKAYREYFRAFFRQFSVKNLLMFIRVVSRKTIRLLSFNLISNKK